MSLSWHAPDAPARYRPKFRTAARRLATLVPQRAKPVNRHGIRALTHFRCRYARFGGQANQGCLPMVYGSFQSLSPAGLLIDDVAIEPDRIVIAARCRAAFSECPDCGRRSGHVHSRYERRLLDFLLTVALFSCRSRFVDFAARHRVVVDAFLRSHSAR